MANFAPGVLPPFGTAQIGGAGASTATAAEDLATYEAYVFGNFQVAVVSRSLLMESISISSSFSSSPTLTTPSSSSSSSTPSSTLFFGHSQGTVQYNLEGSPPYVSDLCDVMAPGGVASPRPLDALANVTALFATTPDLCVPSSFELDYIKVV